MKKTVFLLAASTAILLSGCGKKVALKPEAGKPLPVAAAGAERPATAEELSTPKPQARPERSDELLRRSEKRKDDPFDLPPPGQ